TVLCDNGSSSTMSPQMHACFCISNLRMAILAGWARAFVYFAMRLSFNVNSSDLVAPILIVFVSQNYDCFLISAGILRVPGLRRWFRKAIKQKLIFDFQPCTFKSERFHLLFKKIT